MATREKRQFAICIKNEGCEDLESCKVYRVLPDKADEAEGHLRVTDESGEDYLYPASYFVSMELSKAAQDAFTRVS